MLKILLSLTFCMAAMAPSSGENSPVVTRLAREDFGARTSPVGTVSPVTGVVLNSQVGVFHKAMLRGAVSASADFVRSHVLSELPIAAKDTADRKLNELGRFFVDAGVQIQAREDLELISKLFEHSVLTNCFRGDLTQTFAQLNVQLSYLLDEGSVREMMLEITRKTHDVISYVRTNREITPPSALQPRSSNGSSVFFGALATGYTQISWQ